MIRQTERESVTVRERDTERHRETSREAYGYVYTNRDGEPHRKR